MQNLQYPWPTLPLSGQVIDANSTKLLYSDLKDLAGSISLGIYDYNTNAIATGVGNGKKFFLGYSSEHTKDKIDTFLFGFRQPKGRNYWAFKGTDVLSFEYSDPTYVQHEEWALGYSGSDDCDLQLPRFECGKIYGVRVKLNGNPVLEKLGSPMTIAVYSDPICCDESVCGTGCQDNNIDCSRVVKDLAEKLNKHQVSRLFTFKARYITNDYEAQSVFDMTKYQIKVLDDGSNHALGIIQQNVPKDATVVRTGRSDWYSIYEICTSGTPTDITAQTEFVLPDECNECPTGSTPVAISTNFTVVRPLAGDEDLVGDVAQQAFADAVADEYKAVGTKTFNGTVTGVDVSTDTITVTGHGFKTGDKVTYDNGGGTSITGITDGSDYFVISTGDNTLKLATTFADAMAGTARDLSVVGVGTAHTLTPVITAEFNTSTGGVAVINLTTSNGFSIPAGLNADILTEGTSSPMVCSLGTNTCFAASWVEIGEAYRLTRDLCLTLPRVECTDGNRLAELIAYYTDYPNIVHEEGLPVISLTAGDACEDTYTISQYSTGCMEDACLAADTAVFEDLGSYDNVAWKVVVPEPPAYDAERRCGIRFTVEPTADYIDACEYELGMNPTLDPITFEVTWIADNYVGDFGEVCNFTLPVGKKIKSAQFSRQQGYSLLYQYIKISEAYEPLGGESANKVVRRVLDQNYRHQVQKDQFYRYYYLTFKVDRNNNNFDQKAEVVEATIAIPMTRPDKMAAFEAAILSPLTKFGVTLEKRED